MRRTDHDNHGGDDIHYFVSAEYLDDFVHRLINYDHGGNDIDKQHDFPDFNTAADVVDYARILDDRTTHHGGTDIDDIHYKRLDDDDVAGYLVYVDVAGKFNVLDDSNDGIPHDDPRYLNTARAVYDAAAAVLNDQHDNARPAVQHDTPDSDRAADLWAKRAAYIDALVVRDEHHRGNTNEYLAARVALVAALRPPSDR